MSHLQEHGSRLAGYHLFRKTGILPARLRWTLFIGVDKILKVNQIKISNVRSPNSVKFVYESGSCEHVSRYNDGDMFRELINAAFKFSFGFEKRIS